VTRGIRAGVCCYSDTDGTFTGADDPGAAAAAFAKRLRAA
jgi:hypothetical protein